MNASRKVILKECRMHDDAVDGQRSLYFDVITYYPNSISIARNVHLICDKTNTKLSGDVIECGEWRDLDEDECCEYFQMIIDEANRWVGAY